MNFIFKIVLFPVSVMRWAIILISFPILLAILLILGLVILCVMYSLFQVTVASIGLLILNYIK